MGQLTKVAALAALLVGVAAPAAAGQDVVVHGPDFPEGSAFLSYVPCGGFFAPGAKAPTLRINRGPAAPPAGQRSFGLQPAGAGTASGPALSTDHLAGAGLSFSVFAGRPATGAAYVWYAAPDAPAGHAWRGTARLSAPPGAWTRVDLGSAPYDWTLVDLVTTTDTAQGGRASLTEFVATHGDGPGRVVGGFGCGGESFQLDALTVGSAAGATTYDLEGLLLTTAMEQAPATAAGDGAEGAEGAEGKAVVVLRGVTREADGTPVGEPLVLETAAPGTEDWKAVGDPVHADGQGVVRAQVPADEAALYRWRMPDAEYAAGHVSNVVAVPGH